MAIEFFLYDSPAFENFPKGNPHERGEVKFLESIVKEGMNVIDIGELKHIVSQLEAHYEAKTKETEGEITPLPPEVEKFLRELGNRFNQNEGI